LRPPIWGTWTPSDPPTEGVAEGREEERRRKLAGAGRAAMETRAPKQYCTAGGKTSETAEAGALVASPPGDDKVVDRVPPSDADLVPGNADASPGGATVAPGGNDVALYDAGLASSGDAAVEVAGT
jgi:hypothetical protein